MDIEDLMRQDPRGQLIHLCSQSISDRILVPRPHLLALGLQQRTAGQDPAEVRRLSVRMVREPPQRPTPQTRQQTLAVLPDGRSTLDLCGPEYVVIAGPDAPDFGDKVPVHRISNGMEWAGLLADGALLVRPDQHVAARSDAGLTPGTLTSYLP